MSCVIWTLLRVPDFKAADRIDMSCCGPIKRQGSFYGKVYFTSVMVFLAFVPYLL